MSLQIVRYLVFILITDKQQKPKNQSCKLDLSKKTQV